MDVYTGPPRFGAYTNIADNSPEWEADIINQLSRSSISNPPVLGANIIDPLFIVNSPERGVGANTKYVFIVNSPERGVVTNTNYIFIPDSPERGVDIGCNCPETGMGNINPMFNNIHAGPTETPIRREKRLARKFTNEESPLSPPLGEEANGARNLGNWDNTADDESMAVYFALAQHGCAVTAPVCSVASNGDGGTRCSSVGTPEVDYIECDTPNNNDGPDVPVDTDFSTPVFNGIPPFCGERPLENEPTAAATVCGLDKGVGEENALIPDLGAGDSHEDPCATELIFDSSMDVWYRDAKGTFFLYNPVDPVDTNTEFLAMPSRDKSGAIRDCPDLAMGRGPWLDVEQNGEGVWIDCDTGSPLQGSYYLKYRPEGDWDLRSGWHSHTCKSSGRVYYWNEKTRKTKWRKPLYKRDVTSWGKEIASAVPEKCFEDPACERLCLDDNEWWGYQETPVSGDDTEIPVSDDDKGSGGTKLSAITQMSRPMHSTIEEQPDVTPSYRGFRGQDAKESNDSFHTAEEGEVPPGEIFEELPDSQEPESGDSLASRYQQDLQDLQIHYQEERRFRDYVKDLELHGPPDDEWIKLGLELGFHFTEDNFRTGGQSTSAPEVSGTRGQSTSTPASSSTRGQSTSIPEVPGTRGQSASIPEIPSTRGLPASIPEVPSAKVSDTPALTPITIAMALQGFKQIKGPYGSCREPVFFGWEADHVMLVAQIMTTTLKADGSRYVECLVDDGTEMCMVRKYVTCGDDELDEFMETFRVRNYVRIVGALRFQEENLYFHQVGTVRDYQGDSWITGYHIQCLTDPMEIYYHMVECVRHKQLRLKALEGPLYPRSLGTANMPSNGISNNNDRNSNNNNSNNSSNNNDNIVGLGKENVVQVETNSNMNPHNNCSSNPYTDTAPTYPGNDMFARVQEQSDDPARDARGKMIHTNGGVKEYSIKGTSCKADVEGSKGNIYHVYLSWAEGIEIAAECDCPDNARICKHITAAAHAVRENLNEKVWYKQPRLTPLPLVQTSQGNLYPELSEFPSGIDVVGCWRQHLIDSADLDPPTTPTLGVRDPLTTPQFGNDPVSGSFDSGGAASGPGDLMTDKEQPSNKIIGNRIKDARETLTTIKDDPVANSGNVANRGSMLDPNSSRPNEHDSAGGVAEVGCSRGRALGARFPSIDSDDTDDPYVRPGPARARMDSVDYAWINSTDHDWVDSADYVWSDPPTTPDAWDDLLAAPGFEIGSGGDHLGSGGAPGGANGGPTPPIDTVGSSQGLPSSSNGEKKDAIVYQDTVVPLVGKKTLTTGTIVRRYAQPSVPKDAPVQYTSSPPFGNWVKPIRPVKPSKSMTPAQSITARPAKPSAKKPLRWGRGTLRDEWCGTEGVGPACDGESSSSTGNLPTNVDNTGINIDGLRGIIEGFVEGELDKLDNHTGGPATTKGIVESTKGINTEGLKGELLKATKGLKGIIKSELDKLDNNTDDPSTCSAIAGITDDIEDIMSIIKGVASGKSSYNTDNLSASNSTLAGERVSYPAVDPPGRSPKMESPPGLGSNSSVKNPTAIHSVIEEYTQENVQYFRYPPLGEA